MAAQNEPIAVMLCPNRLPDGKGKPLVPPDGPGGKAHLGLHTGRRFIDHPAYQAVEAKLTDSKQTLVAHLMSLLKAAAAKQSPGACQNTDPSTREGAAWLRGEFEKIYASVSDPASRPNRKTLESVISGNLPPKTERTGAEVYWEHILLRYCGGDKLPLDLERNYSKDLVFSLIGEVNFVARGEQAIQTSATWLNHLLATSEYNVFDTIVRDTGSDGAWVTERWAYRDPKIKHNQVTDGIDTFLISNGEITHKMINYTVEQVQHEAEYYKRIGQEMPALKRLLEEGQKIPID